MQYSVHSDLLGSVMQVPVTSALVYQEAIFLSIQECSEIVSQLACSIRLSIVAV